MENHTRLKMRISRIFRSSFGSCKSRIISDVVVPPVLPHKPHRHQLVQLFSPKPTPFPSISTPKSSQTPAGEIFPSCKIPDRNFLLPSAVAADASRRVPPPSPHPSSKPKPKNSRRKAKKTSQSVRKVISFETLDSYYDFMSSDDDIQIEDDVDDDETTLFSSKSHSHSSDSSISFRRKKARYRRTRGSKMETEKTAGLTPLEGKVKESFAVVKRSIDPYGDFRSSMVEMIVEKHIFGGRDLENLLKTFLSLNSYRHHRVIIEVFTEIWEALFANWS